MEGTGSSSPEPQTASASGGKLTLARPWETAFWILFLGTLLLAAIHWPVLPYFLDHYYHLAAAEGFRQAGGLVLRAFWEAAPEGRPHLYPPLTHLVLAFLLEKGLSPITLARLASCLSLPAVLLAVFFSLRRAAGSRTAFLTAAALAIPYPFFLASANYLPATLTLLLGLGLFAALDRGKATAAGLLLGLSFWTHAGLSALLALSVLVFSLLEPGRRNTAWAALLLGLAVGAPWLAHLWNHRGLLELQPRGEERFFETPLLLMAMGAAGAVVALRDRERSLRFWAAAGLGFLPMLFFYRFRFLAAQGMFPWLLLAGLFAGWAFKAASRRGLQTAAGLTLAALFLGNPTLHADPESGSLSWVWGDTVLLRLAGLTRGVPRATEQSLYNARHSEELAEAVRRHTAEDDLFYSNVSYLSGMLVALTGRATTSQMLREMADRPVEAQIRPAKLIVWLRDPRHPKRRPPALQAAALAHHLRPLGETALAYLYINPRAAGRRRVPPPLLPTAPALLIPAGILLATGWSLCARFRCR